MIVAKFEIPMMVEIPPVLLLRRQS
jgi:hypothetical protein